VGTGRSDDDNDGIPDFADPYRGDPQNGNIEPPPPPSYYWVGGTFRIDGIEATWNAGDYPGEWYDQDSDGLPDCFDCSLIYGSARNYITDPANNSALWQGGMFEINGSYQSFPIDENGYPTARWHLKDAPDHDHDQIPDDLDPYPGDPHNNRGFVWPPSSVELLIDSHLRIFASMHYGNTYYDVATGQWLPSVSATGAPLNTDGDALPDAADPYPLDKYNHNDTDSDGIPDEVEDRPQYAQVLDLNDPTDATGTRSDGVTYLQAYYYTLSDPSWLLTTPFDLDFDRDEDGITDRYEAIHFGALMPRDPEDAAFTPYFQEPSPYDPFVLNIERFRANLPPTHSIQTRAEFESVTGQSWATLQGYVEENVSSGEADWDGDHISNRDEVILFHTSPRIPNLVVADVPIISAPHRPISVSEMTDMLITGRYFSDIELWLRVSASTWNAFKYLIEPCPCNRPGCAGLQCANVQDPTNCMCEPPPVECECGNDQCPKGYGCNNRGCSSSVCNYQEPPMPCSCSNQWCPHNTSCSNGKCSGSLCGYTNPGGGQNCACTGGKNCPHNTSCACQNNCDFTDNTQKDCTCGTDGCKGKDCAQASTTPPTSPCGCKPDPPKCGCSRVNTDKDKNHCHCEKQGDCTDNSCYTPPPCPCKKDNPETCEPIPKGQRRNAG
jgi:hypothetical protein